VTLPLQFIPCLNVAILGIVRFRLGGGARGARSLLRRCNEPMQLELAADNRMRVPWPFYS
jgi:hypothetical protein